MSNENAIIILHDTARNNNATVFKACMAGIEAIEKQIPYKPKQYQKYSGKCKCGAVFMDKNTNYCGNCGQRLDWSKENGKVR